MLIAANVVLICAIDPVSVTDPVPLPDTAAPPADDTVNVPCATDSEVVILLALPGVRVADRQPGDREVGVFGNCLCARQCIHRRVVDCHQRRVGCDERLEVAAGDAADADCSISGRGKSRGSAACRAHRDRDRRAV